MENIVFTQLSISDLRKIIREECLTAISEKEPTLSNSDKGEFLTIEQASEYTHIPVATLYDYTHKKKIPFNKVGKKLLFEKKELTAWIATHRKRTKKETDQLSSNYLIK